VALNIAAKNNWLTTSFDVKTACLRSKIDEDVWVQPLPGHPITPRKFWKLKKALYGTKQAGCCWWLHDRAALAKVGFQSGSEEMSTYIYRDGEDVAFLWIHVDDGLLVGSSEELMANPKAAVSLRDNNVAQKASTMFSSYSSFQYEYFYIIISLLCCV
jgi:hypothetical protein